MPSLINEAYLPATLTVPPMSDEQFAECCSEHADLNFEMTAEGDLVVMLPACSITGVRSAMIGGQLRVVRNKMREYLENGAQLGWLIDPENRSVEIYRLEKPVETSSGIDRIEGDSPLAGFVRELPQIWDPLGD